VIPGRPLPKPYVEEHLELLDAGIVNLQAHITNLKKFGVKVIVAINRFATDSDKEIELIKVRAIEAGAGDAILCTHHADGGKGAVQLATAVVKACEEHRLEGSPFHFLYELDLPIKEKILKIATSIYGASDVSYTEEAEEQIKVFTDNGWGKLPICMAKTQYSLSHDEKLKGAPKGFTLPIVDVRASVGAGFIYPLCGDIRTIPGLPTRPVFYDIDIDEHGNITGLS